jgi:S1-C subfamily serine protease
MTPKFKITFTLYFSLLLIGGLSTTVNAKANNKLNQPKLDLKVLFELPLHMNCVEPRSKLINSELRKIFTHVTCLSYDPPEYQYLISIKHDLQPINDKQGVIQTKFRVTDNNDELMGAVSYVEESVRKGHEREVMEKHFQSFRDWLSSEVVLNQNLELKRHHSLDVVGRDLLKNKLYSDVAPTIFTVESIVNYQYSGKLGTAFLIHPDGLFMTAAHVVEHIFNKDIQYYASSGFIGSQSTLESLENRTGMQMIGLKLDTWSDLAIFTVKDYRELNFDKSLKFVDRTNLPTLGDELLSVGYSQDSWPFTVTKGIISGYKLKFGKVLTQVSSDIESGMSGGPTFSLDSNKVIGVNVLKGTGATTIGWLTGSETIMKFLTKARDSFCNGAEFTEWCNPISEIVGEQN